MTTTLSLDYGTQRIGVAIQAGSLAEPLEVIPNLASNGASGNGSSSGKNKKEESDNSKQSKQQASYSQSQERSLDAKQNTDQNAAANHTSTTTQDIVTEQALARIVTLCQEHQVTQLLVGISEGEMAALTRCFIAILQERLKLPVITWDETLSSATVAARLREKGMRHRGGHGSGPSGGNRNRHSSKQGQTKKPIDHYAAALILEDWLATKGGS